MNQKVEVVEEEEEVVVVDEVVEEHLAAGVEEAEVLEEGVLDHLSEAAAEVGAAQVPSGGEEVVDEGEVNRALSFGSLFADGSSHLWCTYVLNKKGLTHNTFVQFCSRLITCWTHCQKNIIEL